MARLVFRPLGGLVTRDEALRLLMEAARPVARVDEVAVGEAAGRVAAADVPAAVDVPPFARATMDGYAVHAAETPGALRVSGGVAAGEAPRGGPAPGEAWRIATGAPLPAGADAVARMEDAPETAGVVDVRVSVAPGRFVDAAGSDVARGAVVLASGALVTPARAGLVASVGVAHVRVFARPRVVVLPTGDELLAPGDAPRPGAVFDANGVSVPALLRAAGADVRARPAVPDEARALEGALRDALGAADLVVLSGGASVGARDLVAEAVRALDGEVLFHGVRVKPGKPLLAARVADTLVVGLPGNPTSALSNATLFVAPAVRAMARLPPQAPDEVEAELAEDVAGEPERFLFLPVRVREGRAFPVFRGSGALTSLAESDGWVGVAEGARLAAGTRVRVTRW